jgi:hypothetical protein
MELLEKITQREIALSPSADEQKADGPPQRCDYSTL